MNRQTLNSAARRLVIILPLLSGPAVLQNVQRAAANSPAPSTAAVIGQRDCRALDLKVDREHAVAATRKLQYEQAGKCYLAVGDKPKADLRFAKAAAADAAVSKQQLTVGVKQAKALFRKVREPFSSR